MEEITYEQFTRAVADKLLAEPFAQLTRAEMQAYLAQPDSLEAIREEYQWLKTNGYRHLDLSIANAEYILRLLW